MMGLSKKEIIGKNFTELKIIPPEDMEFHLTKITSLLKEGYIKPYEYKLLDKKGKIHWVIIRLTAIMKNKKFHYIIGIATDITKRKLAENKIKSSLREKNILLQEIHHRVNNNMQIVSSLLNLQTKYVDDEEAVNVLKESQNRVKSMAMIHEKLYQSKDLTHINFVDYIQSLVSDLFFSYNVENTQIKPIFQIENVNLNMETAVPCGLIISELVSNSLKYAFPDGKKGKIHVSLTSKWDKYELIISDNGIGLPEQFNINSTDSLGLQLVNNLTEQIDGEIKINRSHGTEFVITFEESKYKKRI